MIMVIIAKFRSMDGSCNNHVHSLWGASLTPLRRVLPPIYENGFNTPVGSDPDRLYGGFRKPNARLVSRRLVSSRGRVTPDPDLTQMVMQWGQFLDHDIDHSMEAWVNILQGNPYLYTIGILQILI